MFFRVNEKGGLRMKKKGLKKLIVTALIGAMTITQFGAIPCKKVQAATIAINAKNFPDQALRNRISNYDTNKDGKLSAAENAAINQLYLSDSGMKNLKGIEKLTNLNWITVYGSDCTSMDFSKNTKLAYINVSNNKKVKTVKFPTKALTTVSLYDNKVLKTSNLYSCKKLERLSVENCSKLGNLKVASYSKLKQLSLRGTCVTNVDVSKNTKLEYLRCGGKISNLKTSTKNKKLNTVEVYGDSKLKTLNLSKLNNLSSINVTNAKIPMKNIKVKKASKIKSMTYAGGPTTAVDFSKYKELTNAIVGGKKVTSVKVSSNKKLQYLSVNSTKVKTINTSKNTSLRSLYANENNNITAISVSGLSKLESLSVYNSAALKSINFKGNNKLISLSLSGNKKLSSVDVSGLTKLTNLYLSKNALTKLDVSKNKNLTSLYADYNKITAFSLDGNNNLRYLSLYNNKLQTVTLTNLSQLYQVNLRGNTIATINMDNLPLLDSLRIKNNNKPVAINLTNMKHALRVYCTRAATITLDEGEYVWENMTSGEEYATETGNVFEAAKFVSANETTSQLFVLNIPDSNHYYEIEVADNMSEY